MLKQKTPRVVITFYTTAEAMATQKLCQRLGLEGRLIPAPRALSADCGIAWSAPASLQEALLAALQEEQIEFAGHHELLL